MRRQHHELQPARPRMGLTKSSPRGVVVDVPCGFACFCKDALIARVARYPGRHALNVTMDMRRQPN